MCKLHIFSAKGYHFKDPGELKEKSSYNFTYNCSQNYIYTINKLHSIKYI